MRVSSQRDPAGNVYFAYASDNRGWTPPGMIARNLSVAVSRLGGAAQPGRARSSATRRQPAVTVAPVHPHEAEQVARIRSYKIEAGGKTYHIYRGDLHRHTDISGDGVGDGSLMDLHRYALDAAAFDFVHRLRPQHGRRRTNIRWWRTQKANDLYTVPGAFISMYGYERSVPYPNGHRNVIWPERGHRTLPLPQRPAQADGRGHRQAVRLPASRPTASARRTPPPPTRAPTGPSTTTRWSRSSRSSRATTPPTRRPAPRRRWTTKRTGSTALTSRTASCRRRWTRATASASRRRATTFRRTSAIACVLAEEFSRKGLIDAMKKRHTYAATDNIVLDVRMGRWASWATRCARTSRAWTWWCWARGRSTAWRCCATARWCTRETPAKDAAEARFHWDDPKPKKGDKASYYYVRVLQKDGQMAWASPIWVNK